MTKQQQLQRRRAEAKPPALAVGGDERVLQAAGRLFREKGFAATTVAAAMLPLSLVNFGAVLLVTGFTLVAMKGGAQDDPDRIKIFRLVAKSFRKPTFGGELWKWAYRLAQAGFMTGCALNGWYVVGYVYAFAVALGYATGWGSRQFLLGFLKRLTDDDVAAIMSE